MNRVNKGFTIVEIIIVIAVIGILSTLAFLGVKNVQNKSRDAERSSKITIISEYLEKYYSKNGEYPSCTAMSQSITDIATNTLIGISPSSLTTPTDSVNTNSILSSCADLTNGVDKFAYVGDGTTTCLTGAYCTKYTLKYYKEETGTVTTSNSRKGQAPLIIPITAIAPITGTAQMGQTLTAGVITPATATASYQWQRALTSGGTYTDISGATNDTYIPTLVDAGKYLKVTATATGTYTGAQTSVATVQVATDSSWKIVGGQIWAAANLNVGTRINNSIDQTNNSIPEKYCYNDLESNCTAHGGLYQWNEVMQYTTVESTQGLCPNGSHIPSDNEWKTLEIYLGMTQTQADLEGYRGNDEGLKIGPAGSSGLNIQFAGGRSAGGSSISLSATSYLWSSSISSGLAYDRSMNASQPQQIIREKIDRSYGFSIRCIRN